MICQSFPSMGMSVQFSPFQKDLLCLATSDNFGIVGNSKLYVLKLNFNDNSVFPVKVFPIQDALFQIAFSEQNPKLVSCVTGNGFFKLYNIDSNNPLIDLKIHNKEVNSVSCNHKLPFLYLTAGIDRKINIIDVNKQKVDLISNQAHSAPINQVTWHPKMQNIFASCGKDGKVMLFDLLKSGSNKHSIGAIDAKDVLCMDFNKYNDTFITGSTDNTIKLYDIRKTKIPLFVYQGHRYGVKSVKFSPFKQNIFISSSL